VTAWRPDGTLVRRFHSRQFRVDHQAYRTSMRRRNFLNQDCVFDLGLESMFLRDPPQKANMSVHFRFGPKATVADKNVIRRMVPSCGHRPGHSINPFGEGAESSAAKHSANPLKICDQTRHKSVENVACILPRRQVV
jgi:hypothetical protein